VRISENFGHYGAKSEVLGPKMEKSRHFSMVDTYIRGEFLVKIGGISLRIPENWRSWQLWPKVEIFDFRCGAVVHCKNAQNETAESKTAQKSLADVFLW
jgi:hypothetical protein